MKIGYSILHIIYCSCTGFLLKMDIFNGTCSDLEEKLVWELLGLFKVSSLGNTGPTKSTNSLLKNSCTLSFMRIDIV